MKNHKNTKLIMSICMMIVVCLSLATATYAWYAGTDPTIMENLNLGLDEKGDLKVEIALESGERMEMNLVDENDASIDMALSKLINIEENKLGPGAFGEVHIFITSNSATYTGYTIKITPNCDLIEDGNEEALQLAKEHIRFYAAKTENGYEQLIPYYEMTAIQNVSENNVLLESSMSEDIENVTVMTASLEENLLVDDSLNDEEEEQEETQEVVEVQEEVLGEVQGEAQEEAQEVEALIKTVAVPTVTAEGITGKIAAGEETEIILYWYWPYEYGDVPDTTAITAQNEREYDLQDTVIGNYIQSIGFTFVVEGNTDEE